MPIVNIYLKERTYLRLQVEAEKYQVTVTKFISMLCDNYVEFLEKEGGKVGEKKIYARG